MSNSAHASRTEPVVIGIDVGGRSKLPEGYFISYEGEFVAQQEASQRIAILSGVIFVIIAFLLYGYFIWLTTESHYQPEAVNTANTARNARDCNAFSRIRCIPRLACAPASVG